MFKKIIENEKTEKYYPICISIIIVIIYMVKTPNKILYPKNFENLLSALLTIQSVFIGFLGVTLTILLSLKDEKIVRYIYKYKSKKLLSKYFKYPLMIGFMSLIWTISMFYLKEYDEYYFFNTTNINNGKIFLGVLLFIMVYFILLSFRVIDIIFNIVFVEENKCNLREKRLDDIAAEKLNDEFKK